jgi:O-antigen ligase
MLASYSQTDSTLILIALVSHSLLWWVVVQLVQHGFGKFLYWSILCVVAGHALMGLIDGGGEASLLRLLGQTQTGDVGSGFVNRNHFASYLGLGAVLAVALALRNARQMTYEGVRSSIVLRVFLSLVALMLITLALLSTHSRMGLAASATGVLAVILLHGFVCRAWGVTATFLLLYVVVLNLAVFFTVDVLERFAAADTDFQTRLDIYRQALELWKIRPWTGFGAGSFETVFATIRDGQLLSGHMITRGHNSYITLLVEMGLLGSLIVLSLFIWLIIEQVRALGRRHYFAGLVGLACLVVQGVHSALDFSAEIYAVMSLLVLMLAMSTGFNQRRRQQSFARKASTPSLIKLTGSAELRTTQVLLYPSVRKHYS